MIRFCVVLIAAVLAAAGSAAAGVKRGEIASLGHYTGSFRWLNSADEELQKVEFCFNDVKYEAGSIKLSGYGRYHSSAAATSIKLTALIEAGRIEIWESEPSGSSSFVVDGSHVGAISRNLMSIKATWTTESDGKSGKLSLFSSPPSHFCPK